MGIVGSRAHPEVADHLPSNIPLSNGTLSDGVQASRPLSNADSDPSSSQRGAGRSNESSVPFARAPTDHSAGETKPPFSSPQIDRLRTDTSYNQRASLEESRAEPQARPRNLSLSQTHSLPEAKPPSFLPRPKPRRSRTERFFKMFIPMFSTKSQQAEGTDPDDLTFRIKRRLSGAHKQGGFSDVYEGLMIDTKEKIAIKCLRAVNVGNTDLEGADVQARLRKRLMREMRVLGEVRHIRIAHLMGHALYDGRPALITPWYSKGSLTEYLPKCKDKDRKRMIIHVGEGLACLHRHVPPIAHSDIKPGNVLIDDDGNAALSDFGLAKILDGEHTGLTTNGDPKYTIRYCAPEALDGSPGSTMADVYSYGCLVYEILSGREPFGEIKAMTALLFAKAQAKFPDRPATPSMPDPVWTLLIKCWSVEPADRPTMDMVMRDLTALNWRV